MLAIHVRFDWKASPVYIEYMLQKLFWPDKNSCKRQKILYICRSEGNPLFTDRQSGRRTKQIIETDTLLRNVYKIWTLYYIYISLQTAWWIKMSDSSWNNKVLLSHTYCARKFKQRCCVYEPFCLYVCMSIILSFFNAKMENNPSYK